jgi:hypothetical protein
MAGLLCRLHISSRSVNTHGCHRQLLFLICQFFNSSPLKLIGQMNRNWVVSIYGRSFKNCSYRLYSLTNMSTTKLFSSVTTRPNETKLGRKHILKVLYKIAHIIPIRLINMATTGNYCFRLID